MIGSDTPLPPFPGSEASNICERRSRWGSCLIRLAQRKKKKEKQHLPPVPLHSVKATQQLLDPASSALFL